MSQVVESNKEVEANVGESWRCPSCTAQNASDSSSCGNCGRRVTHARKSLKLLSAALRGRTSRLRSQGYQFLIGLLIGAAATIATYMFVGANRDFILYRILYPEGLQMLIPVTILGLTYMALVIVLLKLVFVVKDSLGFRPAEWTPLIERIKPALLAEHASAADVDGGLVESIVRDSSPRLRTHLRIVTELLGRRSSGDEIARALEKESDFDEVELEGKYGFLRLVIWTLPILGFLGTVIGITLSVGGFSEFLSGNIEEVDAIKGQLGEVTDGLAFAFGTTILGLAGALVAMISASLTEGYESSFCTQLRRFSVGLLAPAAREVQQAPADFAATPRAVAPRDV